MSFHRSAVTIVAAVFSFMRPISPQQAASTQRERAVPQVGVWVITMFDKADKFGHWKEVLQSKDAMPVGGPYSCSDPEVIAREYADMRSAGIDYVVLDDTNTLAVDDGLIAKAVRAWFDFMDNQPPDQRLHIAIAAGGELNQHSDIQMWKSAVDSLYREFSGGPSYLRDNDKPVLFWYIETVQEPQFHRWNVLPVGRLCKYLPVPG